MKLKSLILALFCISAVSCSKTDSDSIDVFALIKGNVSDEEGKPIEHLEITTQIGSISKVSYSSSDGSFVNDITNNETKDIKSFRIIIKDIDGEENGGIFKTHTEEIILTESNKSDRPIVLNLEFRCSRATL